MRYALALPLLLLATSAFADDPPPHSGIVRTRSMPELSDIALFGMAVAGVWLARRALRKRFAKQAGAAAETASKD
jgi:hypothetical protein